MILEMDYGNTRLKWRLLASNTTDCIAYGAVTSIVELVPAVQEYIKDSLKFCRVCSVRSPLDNNRLSELVRQCFQLEPMYAVATQQLAGVVNGYVDASKLGVDRWLAIVAAYSDIKKACLVFDCGTALTVDYIDAEGVHLGGCIAPGLQMMTTALSANAQQLAEIAVGQTVKESACGRNTQAAISAGVSGMIRGFIKEQLLYAASVLDVDFQVVCTGGDRLFAFSAEEAVLDGALVFKGLAIACPFPDKV